MEMEMERIRDEGLVPNAREDEVLERRVYVHDRVLRDSTPFAGYVRSNEVEEH